MKIIKIGAVWCSGCLVMKPRWHAIEEAYKNHGCPLDTEMYDFDGEDETTRNLLRQYKLIGKSEIIPVAIFLDQQGEEFHRISGEVATEKIMDTIDHQLNREGIPSPREHFKKPVGGILGFFKSLIS